MKLFDDFEAVKFSQENLIFVTHGGYLYYIYNIESGYWQKYRNAGNDHIKVANYQDVTRFELENALQGKFPKKETDFMRLCEPYQLCIRDMLDLLEEDYPKYMSYYPLYNFIHCFLNESDICYKSYLGVRKLLDIAVTSNKDKQQILAKIKKLSCEIIGRDIFKKEIGIVDGHDSSSYFWIMPVRVIDYSDTDNSQNVAEMRSAEISIEEDDVAQYLTPFLYKYFDEELEANKKRKSADGFEWYLTYNFFTFDSIKNILNDIRGTIDVLSSGLTNEFTSKLRENRYIAEDKLIIDFYQRFVYRMEYMLKVGEEKGFNLISFMGP